MDINLKTTYSNRNNAWLILFQTFKTLLIAVRLAGKQNWRRGISFNLDVEESDRESF
jgi:hypothetical protein